MLNANAYDFTPGANVHSTYSDACRIYLNWFGGSDHVNDEIAKSAAATLHHLCICKHDLRNVNKEKTMFFGKLHVLPFNEDETYRNYAFVSDIIDRDVFSIDSTKCICSADDIEELITDA
jgi:hypothetical protein